MAANAPIVMEVRVRFLAIAPGSGPAGLGGLNADDPSQGQSLYPIAGRMAQTVYIQDTEPVPGTPGSYTLANLKTALDNAATSLAGSSGNPIFTQQGTVATVNGWNSGLP